LYYSKAKSELACHILQQFYGLGPDITSRVDVVEGYADDHNKSPNGHREFVFDGKRTCVRAFGGGVKDSKEKNGRDSTQQGKPQDVKSSEQIFTYHKSREVCQGGRWRRWLKSSDGNTYKLEEPGNGRMENKRNMAVNGLSQGPWVFEHCGYKTEGSMSWKHINEGNFYETLEALSEAIKNGGVHPECPVPDRALSEDPPVTAELAKAKKIMGTRKGLQSS
jgi:hypothetical protein